MKEADPQDSVRPGIPIAGRSGQDRAMDGWIARGTLALLWITVLALVWSGKLIGAQWGNTIPPWILIGLAGLSLAVTIAAVLGRVGWSRFITGSIFGLVLVLPWPVAALSGTSFTASGWITAVLALAVLALFLGTARTPPAGLRTSVLVILVIGVWLSIVLVLAVWMGADIAVLHYKNDRAIFGLPQVKGMFGHPNTLAIFAVIAAVVSLQATRAVIGSRGARVGALAVLLGPLPAVLLVLATQSRTGIATLAISLLLVLIPAGRRWGRILAAGVLALLYAGSVIPPLLSVDSVTAFHGRAEAWLIARIWFERSPGSGGGPDAFDTPPPGVITTWDPVHAHSQWLQAIALSGLAGLAVLAVAAVMAAWIALRAVRVDNSWALGVVGSLAAYGWLEPSLGVTAVPITFVPAVLAVAVLGSADTLASVPTPPEPAKPDPGVHDPRNWPGSSLGRSVGQDHPVGEGDLAGDGDSANKER